MPGDKKSNRVLKYIDSQFRKSETWDKFKKFIKVYVKGQ
jgi:hypothetical protein